MNRDEEDGPHVDLSVVVPTYNRRDRLIRVLRALDRQATTSPRGRGFSFEVVVVSDGSTDGTVAALSDLRTDYPLTVVDQANAGPSRARNAGVERASGDLVLFMDDDVVPEPQCVGVHIDRHAGRDDMVIIGPMLTPPDHVLSPWVAWEQHQIEKWYPYFEDHPEAGHHHFYTGNASLHRAAFTEASGFDESLGRAEDVELAWRLHTAGARFEMALDARAFHYAERSLQSWRSIAFDYGCAEIGFVDRGDEDRRRLLRERWIATRPVVRSGLRLAVRVPFASRTTARMFERTAIGLDRIGVHRAARRLLSAAYALHYFAGIDEALGPDRPLEALALSDP